MRFYVAIASPQMPLSKIDGMVNLISARRAKERHLIFGACWRYCSALCEIFAENQIFAKNQIFAWADLPICLGPTYTAKWNPKKWTKKLKSLKPIRFHRPSASAIAAPPHASPHLNGGGRWPGLTQPHGEHRASLPPGSTLAEHGRAQGSSAPPAAWMWRLAAP